VKRSEPASCAPSVKVTWYATVTSPAAVTAIGWLRRPGAVWRSTPAVRADAAPDPSTTMWDRP
jgi:uncharacterized membrane protein